MKKFFGVIFLLLAACLAIMTTLFLITSYREEASNPYGSQHSVWSYAEIAWWVGALVFVLAWFGVKWVRTPASVSSDVIDDELIGK